MKSNEGKINFTLLAEDTIVNFAKIQFHLMIEIDRPFVISQVSYMSVYKLISIYQWYCFRYHEILGSTINDGYKKILAVLSNIGSKGKWLIKLGGPTDDSFNLKHPDVKLDSTGEYTGK